jgi:endoglucanase
MGYDDFDWGSNAVASNQGVWLLHAYYITGESKYYKTAVKVVDYLLGKNPLDMSFLTGYGTKSPMKPHHRPSTADHITPPVPGMLVGGPQPKGQDIGSETWECKDYLTGYPATSYIDNNCSYASNEVAINWNAPFAYLVGAIEAINAGYAPSFAAQGVARPDAIAVAPLRKASVGQSPRLRFADQKLFIEKNGKRFNLNGHRIK